MFVIKLNIFFLNPQICMPFKFLTLACPPHLVYPFHTFTITTPNF